MAEILCKTCNQPVSVDFCSHCGERSSNKRLVAKDLFLDFMDNVLDLQVPLLRTLKELSVRPGKMCHNYVQGIRKPYYQPFKYYLLTVAIFYIVFLSSGLQMSDYAQNFMPEATDSADADQIKIIGAEINELMDNHARLIQFAILPLLTFFCWLFFRRAGYNYTENFVLNIYLGAHTSLIGLLIIPLSFYSFAAYFAVSSSVSIGYHIWGYQQFFKIGWGSAVLRGLLVWIITGITFGLINMVVSIILANMFMDISAV
ncbi:MAG: DUF3667 domain-containing protein [Flavobacteriales bacterium]|nr:DUF3667 domain-containing protein [Flavobacteriales bacterium]